MTFTIINPSGDFKFIVRIKRTGGLWPERCGLNLLTLFPENEERHDNWRNIIITIIIILF